MGFEWILIGNTKFIHIKYDTEELINLDKIISVSHHKKHDREYKNYQYTLCIFCEGSKNHYFTVENKNIFAEFTQFLSAKSD